MAVCCYCIVIMQLIGTSSESATSWEIPSSNTPFSIQENTGRTYATAPAYSIATYTEDIPLTQTSTHNRFRSTSSGLPSAPVKSASIGRHTTDIALAYPTPLQSIGRSYTLSDARLHSYGTQGPSGGGVEAAAGDTRQAARTQEARCPLPELQVFLHYERIVIITVSPPWHQN